MNQSQTCNICAFEIDIGMVLVILSSSNMKVAKWGYKTHIKLQSEIIWSCINICLNMKSSCS